MRKYLLVAAAALLALAANTRAESATVVSQPLSIAAFNVQRFGLSKMEKPEVMDVLTRVLSGYDIVLVQEIVDVSETAIHNLTARVSEAAGQPYAVALSERVGRGSYEQYGFVYRSQRVALKSAQQYPDVGDVFAREPYIATFTFGDVRHLEEITLIGIHTQPTAADVEIDALSDVLDYATSQLGAKNVALIGDFNAGCSYVTAAEWAVNRLKHRSDVSWEIADHTDTTVSSTNCAYDRIVIWGEALNNSLVPGSAGPFRYDAAWGLTFELTEDVSDHYPVHFQLKPQVVSAAESYLQTMLVFSVTDTRGTSGEDVKALAAAAGSGDTASFNVTPLYDAAGALTEVHAEYRSYKLSSDSILDALEAFQTRFPSIVSSYQIGLLRHKAADGGFNDPTVFEPTDSARWYVGVTCPVQSSARCRADVAVRTPIA